ncbi:Crp/Fnr family transcriptional regulator [Hyphomicrobium facile]|uniref:cAMP-binding domain of CRP or a regulatory subunit of cAMP-dependent protein kinases n=1 Tax=Hyphomicrobium facile TaxID=51670 RepID=A0A1I7NQC4_9HYPH|nr:Crp/Fnr family transcriptional regulator [Hyphomicrobium facile]SFV36823.1 cAMP-binding domain of CRP or a regulatory subunit of cAMP-dependent protein kinases [Hyphomicrobium facile]
MKQATSTSSVPSFAKIEPFRALPAEAIERVQQHCNWRHYETGELILDYLDKTDEVFFITEGEVRVSIYSIDGKAITFSDLKAGDMFGEISAIDHGLRSASIEARSRCCIASMTALAFSSLLKTEPDLTFEMLLRFARKIRELTNRVYEFSSLDVANRTRAELLRLARLGARQGQCVKIEPAPTHAEIASRISTHREAVTRELNRLSKLGIVERRGTLLIVKDIERLEDMVED